MAERTGTNLHPESWRDEQSADHRAALTYLNNDDRRSFVLYDCCWNVLEGTVERQQVRIAVPSILHIFVLI